MKCRLCNEDKKLEQSHIIPKFIFRWIKKTSLTGKLRNNTTPDRRSEDGDRLPFLCSECEDLFNKYETNFANNLFKLATEDNLSQIPFTDELLKFIVSIIWRSLKFRLEKDIKMDQLTKIEVEKFNEFFKDCEMYFKNNELNCLNKYSFHIIPLTEAVENLGIIPKLTSTYQRGIDSSFRAFSKENPHEGYDFLCFYVKIPFFLFIVEIVKNEIYDWVNTDVKNQEYILDLEDLTINHLVEEILNTMYDNKIITSKKISDTQHGKILESAINSVQKGINKEQQQSMIAKKENMIF